MISIAWLLNALFWRDFLRRKEHFSKAFALCYSSVSLILSWIPKSENVVHRHITRKHKHSPYKRKGWTHLIHHVRFGTLILMHGLFLLMQAFSYDNGKDGLFFSSPASMNNNSSALVFLIAIRASFVVLPITLTANRWLRYVHNILHTSEQLTLP